MFEIGRLLDFYFISCHARNPCLIRGDLVLTFLLDDSFFVFIDCGDDHFHRRLRMVTRTDFLNDYFEIIAA